MPGVESTNNSNENQRLHHGEKRRLSAEFLTELLKPLMTMRHLLAVVVGLAALHLALSVPLHLKVPLAGASVSPGTEKTAWDRRERWTSM